MRWETLPVWLHCHWNYISECFSDSLTFCNQRSFFFMVTFILLCGYTEFICLIVAWLLNSFLIYSVPLLIDIVFHPTCLRSSVHEVPKNCKQKIYPSCSTVCIVWDIKLSIYLQYCAKILQTPVNEIRRNSLLFDKLWSETSGRIFEAAIVRIRPKFCRSIQWER